MIPFSTGLIILHVQILTGLVRSSTTAAAEDLGSEESWCSGLRRLKTQEPFEADLSREK